MARAILIPRSPVASPTADQEALMLSRVSTPSWPRMAQDEDH